MVVAVQISMRLTTPQEYTLTALIWCTAAISPRQTCGSFTWTRLARSGGWWTQSAYHACLISHGRGRTLQLIQRQRAGLRRELTA